MRPYGPSFFMNGIRFSCSKQNMMTGSTNTSVLPEPVNAIPMISLPSNLHEKQKKLVQFRVVSSILKDLNEGICPLDY